MTEDICGCDDANGNSDAESWEISEISYDSSSSNDSSNEPAQLQDDLKSDKRDQCSDIDNILLEKSDSAINKKHSSSNVKINKNRSLSENSNCVFLNDQSDKEISVNDNNHAEEILLSVKQSPRKYQSPIKWTPQISSVSRLSDCDADDVNKNNSHFVLIPEDIIKKEEFVDENEECIGFNDKYPSSSYTNFSIKLEKLDFSYPRNEEIIQSPIKKKIRSRTRRSSRSIFGRKKRRPKQSLKKIEHCTKSSEPKNESKKVETCVKSLRSRNISNTDTESSDRRSSLRLIGKSPKEGVLPLIEKKQLKKRSNVNTSVSEKKDKSLGVLLKENVKSTTKNLVASTKYNQWTPIIKLKPIETLLQAGDSLKNSDMCTPFLKKKKVSFSNSSAKPANDIEKSKPADCARNKVTDEIKKSELTTHECENLKKNIDVLYECLCCDQKYYSLENVKQHVRGHFPHVLTS